MSTSPLQLGLRLRKALRLSSNNPLEDVGGLDRRQICERATFRGWELLSDGGNLVILPETESQMVAALLLGCFAKPCVVTAFGDNSRHFSPSTARVFAKFDIPMVDSSALSSSADEVLEAGGVVALAYHSDPAAGDHSESGFLDHSADVVSTIAAHSPPYAAVCSRADANGYELEIWDPSGQFQGQEPERESRQLGPLAPLFDPSSPLWTPQ